MQLWDLDDILKGSGNNISQAAESDSDGDDMDVDNKGVLDLLGNVINMWWFLDFQLFFFPHLHPFRLSVLDKLMHCLADYLLLCTNYDMIPGGHLHVMYLTLIFFPNPQWQVKVRAKDMLVAVRIIFLQIYRWQWHTSFCAYNDCYSACLVSLYCTQSPSMSDTARTYPGILPIHHPMAKQWYPCISGGPPLERLWISVLISCRVHSFSFLTFSALVGLDT